MNQWYVKDLSKITGVSTQTLHHYDHIDLLKPSVRLPNGYRLYTEKDLLRLQQIIALKYFGFELVQIKQLLSGEVNMQEHFLMQAQFLKQKADTLLDASKTLAQILPHCDENKSIPWETIIELIEIYRMTQKLEKTWRGAVFSHDELKQYADLLIRYPEDKIKNFEAAWLGLSEIIHSNLDNSPKSKVALDLAKQAMDLINGLYGKENANLRHTLWEQGFKTGSFTFGLSIEGVHWLDQAFHAYYNESIYTILNNVDLLDNSELYNQWNALLEDMYGNNQALKQTVIDAVMNDERVSIKAREWLILISHKYQM